MKTHNYISDWYDPIGLWAGCIVAAITWLFFLVNIIRYVQAKELWLMNDEFMLIVGITGFIPFIFGFMTFLLLPAAVVLFALVIIVGLPTVLLIALHNRNKMKRHARASRTNQNLNDDL